MNNFKLDGEFFLGQINQEYEKGMKANVPLDTVFVNETVYHFIRKYLFPEYGDTPVDKRIANIKRDGLTIRICESLELDQFQFGI